MQGSSPHFVSRQPGHLPPVKSGHGAQLTPQYAIKGSIVIAFPFPVFYIFYHGFPIRRKTGGNIFTAI